MEQKNMPSHFQVQDLVDQTTDSVVYKVLAKDGSLMRLTRIRLDSDEVERMRVPGVFQECLDRLQSLRHEYLAHVVDGGLDEVDGCPWVVTRWVEGKPLHDRRIREKEIRSLGEQFHGLIADLGEHATAVDFDPARIITVRTPDERLHSLFSIDYPEWFGNWAAGQVPGAGRDAPGEVRKLLEALAIRQLQRPVKESKEAPIPMVEERSPALDLLPEPRDPWLGRLILWLILILSLGIVAFVTWQGVERAKENPRKEAPLEAPWEKR